MPQYHYQALNAERQLVSGQLQAESLSQAVALLEAEGLTIQSILDAAAERRSASFQTTAGRESQPTAGSESQRAAAEQAVLQRHMAVVIERGRELLPALCAYAAEMPAGRRRRQLESVLRILERGDAAEAATAIETWPEYWIPLLGAATSARDPGRILREFLRESQRAAELHRQWWQTLAYPAFLASLAVVVMTGLSFLVIPLFREIFLGFELQVSPFTVFVLSVADWITSGRMAIAFLVVAVIVVLALQARKLLPTAMRDWFSDHLGVRWGRSTAIARLAQFTADLLEAELTPAHALRLAGLATNRQPVKRAAWRVASELESGGIPAQDRNRRVLSATILHVLQTDMSTPTRIHLLREIGNCHADRARNRLSWSRGVMEPIAICAIGLVVGATVLALFLPLIALINGLA